MGCSSSSLPVFYYVTYPLFVHNGGVGAAFNASVVWGLLVALVPRQDDGLSGVATHKFGMSFISRKQC